MIKQYNLNKKKDAKRKELLKENMQLTLLDDYDPLSEVEQPAPTFRGQDERRKAQFNEVIFGIGRLHNFQKKISGLTMRVQVTQMRLHFQFR